MIQLLDGRVDCCADETRKRLQETRDAAMRPAGPSVPGMSCSAALWRTLNGSARQAVCRNACSQTCLLHFLLFICSMLFYMPCFEFNAVFLEAGAFSLVFIAAPNRSWEFRRGQRR